MKLQIYTTMSPTKQNNEESNNDIDIARQQLNTAKEKVESSLQLFENYKSKEDALWKIDRRGMDKSSFSIQGIT